MLVPDQVEALLAGRIDLALLRLPVDEPGLRVTTLRRERLIVALPETHRLSRRRRLRMQDLREEDLIVHASHGRSVMHATVMALCREAGFQPRVRHEVAETSTLVTFVAAGLGVAIVPEPVAELGVAGAATACWRHPAPGSIWAPLCARTTTHRHSPGRLASSIACCGSGQRRCQRGAARPDGWLVVTQASSLVKDVMSGLQPPVGA
jgi:DNA-binding transcriptional LysR family regulator